MAGRIEKCWWCGEIKKIWGSRLCQKCYNKMYHDGHFRGAGKKIERCWWCWEDNLLDCFGLCLKCKRDAKIGSLIHAAEYVHAYSLNNFEDFVTVDKNCLYVCYDCYFGANGEWSARPANINHGIGCPNCMRHKFHFQKIKSWEYYKKSFEKMHVRLLDSNEKYIGSSVQYSMVCTICNYGSDGNWKPYPNHINRGGRCPNCKKVAERKLGKCVGCKKLLMINPSGFCAKCVFDQYKEDNPGLVRMQNLHTVYRVSISYMCSRFFEQDGLDPITLEPIDCLYSDLDHNRITGMPRGVLEHGNVIIRGSDLYPYKFIGLKKYLINNVYYNISDIDDKMANDVVDTFYCNDKYLSSLEHRIKECGGSFILKSKLWLSGNKKCHACGKDLLNFRKSHFDHDHLKNKPRGILCLGCNQSLVAGFETPEIFDRAIAYLEEWKERHKHFTKDKRSDWVAPEKKSIIK